MTQAIGPVFATFRLPIASGAAIPWRYLASSDHRGVWLDQDGVAIGTATHGIAFIILPEGDTAGGTGHIRLLAPPPLGATALGLYRKTAAVQLYGSTPGAEGVAQQLDREILILQEVQHDLENCILGVLRPAAGAPPAEAAWMAQTAAETAAKTALTAQAAAETAAETVISNVGAAAAAVENAQAATETAAKTALTAQAAAETAAETVISNVGAAAAAVENAVAAARALANMLEKNQNLADLPDKLVALDNLGGSATGKHIFGATDPSAVRNLLSLGSAALLDVENGTDWENNTTSLTNRAAIDARITQRQTTAPGRMTLLGTLPTTYGSVHTLPNLILTRYTHLMCFLRGVSHNHNMSQSLYLGAGQIIVLLDKNYIVMGQVSVDLANGAALSTHGNGALSTPDPCLTRLAMTGYSTASTEITFRIYGSSFDAGSIAVYGVN